MSLHIAKNNFGCKMFLRSLDLFVFVAVAGKMIEGAPDDVVSRYKILQFKRLKRYLLH